MAGVLEGRAALITGAGGSIGAASARAFAEAGARLVLLDRHERVREVASGLGAKAIVGDSADEAVVAEAVERCPAPEVTWKETTAPFIPTPASVVTRTTMGFGSSVPTVADWSFPSRTTRWPATGATSGAF